MSYIRTRFIYIGVSLIIIIPLLLLNLYTAIDNRDNHIADLKLRADNIAIQVNHILQGREQEELEQTLVNVANLFLNYGIGYYSLENAKFTSYSNTQDIHEMPAWLRSTIHGEQQTLESVEDDSVRVARPYVSQGQLAGYISVSTSIENIRANFRLHLVISIIAIAMVWILVLLLIRALASRFNHSLEVLSYQVQFDEGQQDDHHLFVYPDIKPIVERINRKNNDLRNMAQKYINESYKMKQLMDMTPLGILSVDEKGTISACNATYCQFYPEIDKDQFPGMNIRTLSERSRIPEVEQCIVQALSGEQTHARTFIYDQKVLLVFAYPIYDENQYITGALGICQDITEIEKLRNELHRIDRLHIVGQMAASFAHEVRNPLTVIRGFMQLMQRQLDPSKIQEYLEMVINELDRSNEIIGNFLSLSQNRFLEKEKVNLNKIIEEIETLLRAEANHSNIELVTEKDPSLQDLMLNDKEIKQLLLNLSRNAIESMNAGGKLFIRTVQLSHASVLEVQDTGHGISQDKLDQLFEPFYTTKPSGTGLGLAVCLSIVEQHQAQIRVESRENVGTTFTIEFKLEEDLNSKVG